MPKRSKRCRQLKNARECKRRLLLLKFKQAAALAIDGGIQHEENGGNEENSESRLAFKSKALLQEALMLISNNTDFIAEAPVKQESIILQNNWECTDPYNGETEASISYCEETFGNTSLTKCSQGTGRKSKDGLVSQKEAAMMKEASVQTELSILQIDKQTKDIPGIDMPQVASSQKRTLHETNGNRYQKDMSSPVTQFCEIRKILSRPVTILPKPLLSKAFIMDPSRVEPIASGITAKPSTSQDFSSSADFVTINPLMKLTVSQNSFNPLLTQNSAVVSLPNLMTVPNVAQSYVGQPTQTTSPITASKCVSSPSMLSKGVLVSGTSLVSHTLKSNKIYNKESQNNMALSALHQNKNNPPPIVTSSFLTSSVLQTAAGEAYDSSRRPNCSSVGEFQSRTQPFPFSVFTLSHIDSSSSSSYIHPKLSSSGTTKETDNLCNSNSSVAQCETTCSEESYHFSSEDESDVLENQDLNKSLQGLNHDKLKAHIIRQRNRRPAGGKPIPTRRVPRLWIGERPLDIEVSCQ